MAKTIRGEDKRVVRALRKADALARKERQAIRTETPLDLRELANARG